ncbi:hypothetical protein [Streptomyces sp. NPDC047972]|uniref:hypothetical protein n=1 Tax=Streptomyces sp. NPDC047972 TaxID=3365493 RepID=UPI00371972D0
MTRPSTPDRINPDGSRTMTTKRACNGCGDLLGDVTGFEVNAALWGRPLPDVRRECPNCGPSASEPACTPTVMAAGDMLCLELECDHEDEDGKEREDGAYCPKVRKDTICSTHSTFDSAELGWDEITHAEPWPCQYDKAVAS